MDVSTDKPAGDRTAAVLSVTDAELRIGERVLWSDMNLAVRPGEFVAVLGANGTGKTSLFRAVLGAQPLSRGRIEVLGQPVRRGRRQVGYVPQQHLADRDTPLRARDFLALGLDGSRFGLPIRTRAQRAVVDDMLDVLDVRHLARSRIGDLSGGEQQRLRIGQSLIGGARLLLCDEPLVSLDLRQQRSVSGLIDLARRTGDRPAVLMITHDINPVLDLVDTVVYIANGQVRTGPVDEVLTGPVLSEMFDTTVDVIRVRDRIMVVGLPDEGRHSHDAAPVSRRHL